MMFFKSSYKKFSTVCKQLYFITNKKIGTVFYMTSKISIKILGNINLIRALN